MYPPLLPSCKKTKNATSRSEGSMVTVLVSVVAAAVAADVGGIDVTIVYVALLTIITNITNSSFVVVGGDESCGFFGRKKMHCLLLYTIVYRLR